MAAKPDLTSAGGVQNVVVYVSNDNFAQTYAVEQDVSQQSTVLTRGYPNTSHSLASNAQTKNFSGINSDTQGEYFTNIISQNGFPLDNIGYQNGATIKSCLSKKVLSCDREQNVPGRLDNDKQDECDNRKRYTEPYVTVLETEVSAQSVRCDSVRSETAESSCSSFSSVDEGIVVVKNRSPEMVVYDPSVSVRPGSVVLVGSPQLPQQAQSIAMVGASHRRCITVPHGWKRLLSNGTIIYISPSNTALSSLEQVKEYLLTSGTCKCGLECHFKHDTVFNFDPKVIGKPWVLSPDTNTGDLTKLCNHKRKIMATASLDCKPPDPGIKIRKELGLKRKKRKIGVPYAEGVSVSQILAQREKLALEQQEFTKEVGGNYLQGWSAKNTGLQGRLSGFPENSQNQMVRCQDQPANKMIAESPGILGNNNMVASPSNISGCVPNQQVQTNQQLSHPHGPNIHMHSHQVIGPNGQLVNVHGVSQGHNNLIHHAQNQILQGTNINIMQSRNHQQQHRVFVNGQPSEPSGPGRPNFQMVSSNSTNQQLKAAELQQKMQQQHMFGNSQQLYQQIEPNKNVSQFSQAISSMRPQCISNQNQLGPNNMMQMQQQQQIQQQHMQQKIQWQNRMQQHINQQQINQTNQIPMHQHSALGSQNPNIYERVPPLHQHTPNALWQEEIKRKKGKLSKVVKNRQYHVVDNCQVSGNHVSCPNIDVRQIPNENNRSVVITQQQQHNHNASSPSFMEDPSGYLAQQTALLNNTINRQTGVHNAGYICNSPITSIQGSQHNIIAISNSQAGEVPLPSNINPNIKPHVSRVNQNINIVKQQIQQSSMSQQQYNQIQMQQQQTIADSSVLHDHPMNQYIQQCRDCVADPNMYSHNNQNVKINSRSDSDPGTPSSCSTSEDPVTSSMYLEKHSNQPSPDTRPIQGGTVSTSNVSPMEGVNSDPPTPNSHTTTPTPPQKAIETMHSNSGNTSYNGQVVQILTQSRENYIQQQQYQQQISHCHNYTKLEQQSVYPHLGGVLPKTSERSHISGIVTTMASGRTSGSNTITSVLAGRTNTATVSINSPASHSGLDTSTSNSIPTIHVNVSKSPLEMVQSVVSSIQVPQSQHQNISVSIHQSSPQVSPQMIKHSPTGLPSGHILVSSNGQLIMTSTGNGQTNIMAPPPPKVMTNQNAMPPISVSSMITNVTAAVTQMIPAVAQQVLGQQTVLVNALSTPFVIQPGVTMTMDGMTVSQNMQIPQIVTGNVIQQQLQLDNNESRRASTLLSPETKKKGKKRKLPSQTVAGMLHIAAQQNSGVVMNQQGFSQQIQMTHSPQGLTTPVMQALTIVPSKNGGPPQIVMNGQAVANANLGAQQILTNAQPTQQINLLQPVNFLNGTTGMVQNFPIQQFIVPNIGGSMVMNPDGTATILQDTSNLGMQLHIQNVNGQNVLTPIQNNSVFNGGQSILAAGPAGMVIRAPTSQSKLIQQQHSPGAQFLSPNGGQIVVNGAQFSGQLSPLVASVSPSQQLTFSTSPQQIRPNTQIQPAQQEFIQMNGQIGQTLMVPCTPPTANISVPSSNQQNTTFVQQNTTIVQQQTTMVANNQQMQNLPQNSQQSQQNVTRSATLNLDQQNLIMNPNDNKQMQVMVQQQQDNFQDNLNYRQSVSTQTAANQNSQVVTTNTFCQTSTLSAGSPPDTTTLSPITSGGQSPPTADTTTHTGSTDDGLSPSPSNCSATCSEINVPGRPGSRTMAMVHYVSSSEPDPLETSIQLTDQDWRRTSQSTSSVKQEYASIKHDLGDVTSGQMIYGKRQNLVNVAYAESSNLVSGMQFLEQKVKHEVMSAKHYEKMVNQKKSSDIMVVMEARNNMTLFDDNDGMS